MKLLKISGGDKGFTLLELLVVVGILAIILALGGSVGFGFYLDYQLDAEYNLLLSLLKQARNLSMTNHNESHHGLYIEGEDFVIFQGSNYASRVVTQDRSFRRTASITITGPSEILFLALSGDASTTSYTVSDGRKSRTINVNSEGLVYEP